MPSNATAAAASGTTSIAGGNFPASYLKWDTEREAEDRRHEVKADADHPFDIDRRVLRDVVRQKMGAEVARIQFLSSGTFHKAYLVTLVDARELVARVARRFMPRLKTESEVATLNYLRLHTQIPVPTVYYYDCNPYNRLGGEYILMSKAAGIPLSRVFNSLPLDQLTVMLRNLAALLIPLFGHRFSHIGSLYAGPGALGTEIIRQSAPPPLAVKKKPYLSRTGSTRTPKQLNNIMISSSNTSSSSTLHTPNSPSLVYPLVPLREKSQQDLLSHISSSLSSLSMQSQDSRLTVSEGYTIDATLSRSSTPVVAATPIVTTTMTAAPVSTAPSGFHIGPIISWPFFGSQRGDLQHPSEIDRGPWSSTYSYLVSSARREITGVRLENEGRSKPHRLHLDPDEIVPKSGYGFALEDTKDERDDDGSSAGAGGSEGDEDEDDMYRDYRRYQRSTFLVAHLVAREERAAREMERFVKCMVGLEEVLKEQIREINGAGAASIDDGGGGGDGGPEEFGLDCHDLSLENVFVDEHDPTQITCIIDWESTTIRPLWACAHLPSFLLTSPFCAALYRRAVSSLPTDLYPYASEWLNLERLGASLRYAHKCIEWDGWEEGLVDEILDGPAGSVHHHVNREDDEDRVRFRLQNGQTNPTGRGNEDGETEPLVIGARLGQHAIDTSVVSQVDEVTKAHPLANPNGSHRDGSILLVTTNNNNNNLNGAAVTRVKNSILVRPSELQLERTLNHSGDECGGRGGELGRRLEAWIQDATQDGVPSFA